MSSLINSGMNGFHTNQKSPNMLINIALMEATVIVMEKDMVNQDLVVTKIML